MEIEQYESLSRKLAIHLQDTLEFKYVRVNSIIKLQKSQAFVVGLEMSNNNIFKRLYKNNQRVNFIVTSEDIQLKYDHDATWDANFCFTIARLLGSKR